MMRERFPDAANESHGAAVPPGFAAGWLAQPIARPALPAADAPRPIAARAGLPASPGPIDRGQDDYLAMLAHELRGPLAPIMAAAHLLSLAPADSALVCRAAAIIRRQSAQMAALLDDLLTVTASDRARLALRPVRTALRSIVDTAVETARPWIDDRRHSLVVDLRAGYETVLVDPVRVSQIVSNLLVNAAKYTDPGGHIVLRVDTAAGDLCFSVRDNGVGIAEPDQRRLFEMYAQGHGSDERAAGGRGIGLALVRQLVELHGGTAEVHSDGPGAGSEFVVRLPLAADRVTGVA